MKVLIKVIDRGSGSVTQVLNRSFKSRRKMNEILYSEGLEPCDYMVFKSAGYNKTGEQLFGF